ncbi:abscisic acid receptor PYL11-like [Cornus florida]|uniref:abscisic acid receptor PYL11-like n=1 Tax=Cornus florida TaxID=4283 RepID=UPI00289E3D49|nr:abscisic acid receptor PYL11-like [Cornus florida]
MKTLYHTHNVLPHQCSSTLVQTIDAPLARVWSFVRRFNEPQGYKQLIKSCIMHDGDGGVGSVREVTVKSGLPAERSIERLDMLDDDMHVMVFSIIGGDHRLSNYQSTLTVHQEDGGGKTVVIESYVVDIPDGNSKEETCWFINTIVRCNLKSLAEIAEGRVRRR